MDTPLILFFSGAALLASTVYAVSRLNREAAATFVLARSLDRDAGGKRRKKAAPVEAPDGWPIAL